MDDETLIRRVYAERGRKDASGVLVRFAGCSAAVQRGVAARLDRELSDALSALRREQGA